MRKFLDDIKDSKQLNRKKRKMPDSFICFHEFSSGA